MTENSKSYSILGIMGGVLAILSFIPIMGVILIPLALILSALSLIKRNNTMAVITFAIGFMKLFITPTLWAAGPALLIFLIFLLMVNGILITKNSIIRRKSVIQRIK